MRVAKIMDSILDLLIGPSLKRDQFANPFAQKYPLNSYFDDSFEASESQVRRFHFQRFAALLGTLPI